MTYAVEFTVLDQSQFAVAQGPVMAFAGPAEKGPFGQSVLLSSVQEAHRLIGEPLSDDEAVEQAIQAILSGARVRFSRTSHLSGGSITAVKASVTLEDEGSVATGATRTTDVQPVSLNDEDVLGWDVDGTVVNITFRGQPAGVTAGTNPTWNLTGNLTLTVKVDRGPEQTIVMVSGDFADLTAVTRDELKTAIGSRISGGHLVNSGSTVRLQSDARGTASFIQVTGGSANTILQFPTTESAASGTNNVPNLRAVMLEDLKALIDASAALVSTVLEDDELTILTDDTGADVHLGFSGSTTGVAEKWGWVNGSGGRGVGTDSGVAADSITIAAKEHGVWANGATVVVSANADDADKVDLVITSDHPGIETETFIGIDPDHLPTSAYWDFTKEGDEKPDTGTFTLSGGTNGTSSITQAERMGVVAGASNVATGIYAIIENDFLDVFVPSLTDKTAHGTLASWCSSKSVMAHVEGPSGLTKATFLQYVRAEGAYAGQTVTRSPNLRYLYGRLEILTANGITKRTIGPSGHVAGVIGVNDFVRLSNDPGPWLSPDGMERGLVGRLSSQARPLSVVGGFVDPTDNAVRDSFSDNGIGYFENTSDGLVFWGNRVTLGGTTKRRYVNVNRLLFRIQRQITPAAMRWRSEPITTRLFKRMHADLDKIMLFLSESGAFQRVGSDGGYQILCDQNAKSLASDQLTINTPEGIDQGTVKAKVRFRPVTGAELVEIELVLDASSVVYN